LVRLWLARERKAVPISSEDLARFAGTYQMSSGRAYTFTSRGDSLELNAADEMMSSLYQGVEAGHPRFYVAMIDGEIEFVPDPAGAMTTVPWHQHGNEQTCQRH
jgi:hypothetical protein